MGLDIKGRMAILKKDRLKAGIVLGIPVIIAFASFVAVKETAKAATADAPGPDSATALASSLPIPEEKNPDTLTYNKEDIYREEYVQQQRELAAGNEKQVSDREAFDVFLSKVKEENANNVQQPVQQGTGGGQIVVARKTAPAPQPAKVEITPGNENSYLTVPGHTASNPARSEPPKPTVRTRTAPVNGTGATDARINKNSISAVVHNWGNEIRNGSSVRMRTLEEFTLNGVKVPVNTTFTGVASFMQERLKIAVTSINVGGIIYPVDLAVYDQDGVEGLYAPSTVGKEIANDAVNKAGSETKANISIPYGIGDISIGSGQKLKDNPSVKVTDGYRILLKPSKR